MVLNHELEMLDLRLGTMTEMPKGGVFFKIIWFPEYFDHIFEKHCFLGMPTDILVLAEGDFTAGEC